MTVILLNMVSILSLCVAVFMITWQFRLVQRQIQIQQKQITTILRILRLLNVHSTEELKVLQEEMAREEAARK